jgi:hypothetical protein
MTDIQHEQLQFSRQYWEALDRMDYEWADFIASCLEVRGLTRLEKSECKDA